MRWNFHLSDEIRKNKTKRYSKIKDQVCILSRHKFTLFRKTILELFSCILVLIASSITESREWFFLQKFKTNIVVNLPDGITWMEEMHIQMQLLSVQSMSHFFTKLIWGHYELKCLMNATNI